MIDLACGWTEAEVWAKPIPKIQAEGKASGTKQPQEPYRASMP
jgi:hypothetical protein